MNNPRWVYRLVLVFCIVFVCMSTAKAVHRTHIDDLLPHIKLQKPIGDGPFPMVLMVAGCSGFDSSYAKESYNQAQRLLVKAGFLVVRVDLFNAWDIDDCTIASLADIALQIRTVANHFQSKDYVKKDAINVIGWSYGGGAALETLSPAEDFSEELIDSIVAYYPFCAGIEYPESYSLNIPVLILHGKIDGVAELSYCKMIFSDFPKKSVFIVKAYDNAHHGFDNSFLPKEFKTAYGMQGYNEKAAKDAWNEILKFLKR